MLITTEIIHSMKRNTKRWRGELALKIYISYAYDRVDWGFLRGVLMRMAFSEKWIQWIMMCVSSITYEV